MPVYYCVLSRPGNIPSEGARLVSRDVITTWHGALTEFGARLTALGDTLPGMLTGTDEAEIARIVQREIRAALGDLQNVVDAIETGLARRAGHA